MKTAYRTKQRDAVLECIIESEGEHITADDIIDRLREKNAPVGKATVYRYLAALVDDGAVRKFLVEEGMPACYQYLSSHASHCARYHLKCCICGELSHTDVDMSATEREIKQRCGFSIDNSKTVLYGLCKHCGGGMQHD